MKRFLLLIIISFIPLNCFAKSSSTIVVDVDSGRILYNNNSSEKRLIASITKIMTCIIVLENTNLDDKVEVGEEVLEMYGTNIYVELGEVLTVRDLLYGLMLRSGNDASVVLAKYVAGSEERFVEMMNDKALKLGMKNTIYNNSHGLDEKTKNYSTAYDMSILSRYAYKNKIYRKIINTKKYVTKSNLKSYVWYNRMSLINKYKYCVGGKNGYTPKAGKTLVSYAKKDDFLLSIVTLNDDDIYSNHEKLYSKYFDQYKIYKIVSKKDYSNEYYLKKDFYYPLNKEETKYIYTLLSIYPSENKGVIGKVDIMLYKDKIGSLNVYKRKKKKEANFFQKIISYLKF